MAYCDIFKVALKIRKKYAQRKLCIVFLHFPNFSVKSIIAFIIITKTNVTISALLTLTLPQKSKAVITVLKSSLRLWSPSASSPRPNQHGLPFWLSEPRASHAWHPRGPANSCDSAQLQGPTRLNGPFSTGILVLVPPHVTGLGSYPRLQLTPLLKHRAPGKATHNPWKTSANVEDRIQRTPMRGRRCSLKCPASSGHTTPGAANEFSLLCQLSARALLPEGCVG